jgi:copper(I)-binding protein
VIAIDARGIVVMRYYLNKCIALVGLLLVILGVQAAAVASLTSEAEVKGAYVYIPMPGKTVTAAFFTLRNNSAKPITLVGIRTAFAKRAELHSHTHEDGMMKMRREDKIEIPANSEVVFESGSWHVMLFDIVGVLQTGEQLQLTLDFSDGTHLPFTAQVKSRFDKAHH